LFFLLVLCSKKASTAPPLREIRSPEGTAFALEQPGGKNAPRLSLRDGFAADPVRDDKGAQCGACTRLQRGVGANKFA
jgi:hypothetical protein